MLAVEDPVAAFIDAACVPLDRGHGSGTLDRAESILSTNPEVATASIHTAAILGNEDLVRQFIETDPQNATDRGGPRNWDVLTHLCFSRYLRLDRARSESFIRSAMALLDAGASANTGWFEKDHQPQPEWESALYGAAGVAHHADLTRLLLERGADPNDAEVTYHTPETYDNDALKALVESGRLTADSLATLLLRKADWHDYYGIKFLLENGADPNRRTAWGNTGLHNAVISDNAWEIVELMLDHGADPTILAQRPNRARTEFGEQSAIEIAARRGRSELLALLEKRGFAVRLAGLERLITACARDDSAAIASIIEREPELADELVAEGGQLLAQFAGNGNVAGARNLLDLGVGVDQLFVEGDGYFDVARHSTALHVAAWRAKHGVVKLLLERGAAVDAPDGKGRTPLALAVKACVDSYWTERRSPETVKALLEAGASLRGVVFPSGYDEVDELLESHLK